MIISMFRRLVALSVAGGLLFALNCTAAERATWVPVRETSLVVAPGSPLDFSSLLPNRPIDAQTHLVVGRGGHIAFSDTPDQPVRLFCASLAWSPASGGFPDHADAEIYARQLAMHGYNIARFHFVDASLMDGRAIDFDFDPETLDRLWYLMAALKKNGISWIMDGVTSPRGAYGGFDDRWDMNGSLKLDLYTSDVAFQHWLELQKRLLGTVNPYTGIAPLADPALALVVLANENGLQFDSWVYARPGQPPYAKQLQPLFDAWLLTRYGSTAQLAKAWGAVPHGERLEDASVALPDNRDERSHRTTDMLAFFADLERRTADKLTAALRGLGYKGMISDYNNWATIQTGLSREALQVVTMNAYQGFVSSYEAGARIEQKSSLADGINYLREVAAGRWLGRPFVLTEYDQLFWNRYRYEAGLAAPAFAALQGWDAICRHAQGPIALRYGEDFPQKTRLLPYAIALDPVARAGETLAALLFRRGDVATSPLDIRFSVTGEGDLPSNPDGREPQSLTQLALVAGIGLARSDSGTKEPTIAQPREDGDLAGILARLRGDGALPKGNATSPQRGVFQSTTGEFTVNTRALQATVATPRTDAVAFARLGAPVTAGPLRVTASSGSALVAVSALDGANVAESHRLLLIFATDARNSDMRFADADAQVIADYGHLPAVIRQGTVTIGLAGRGAWTISPVGLDGVVHSPVASGSGPVATTLNNVGPDGPTTYFLIER